MGSDPALLAIDDLVLDVATPQGWKPILHGVSLEVRRGEVVGLVGESGSGKSMTCLSVLQLHPTGRVDYRGGSITVEGRELMGASPRELNKVRGREVAMVFQEPMTSLNPSLRIGRQLTEHVRFHEGISKREADLRAIEMLSEVGVPDPKGRMQMFPHEFSGGMRQRIMLAMALMGRPRLLIADEPTTALDVTVAAQILELIKRIQREHEMGVLIVTHDMGVVADVCDHVAVMRDGHIVERAPVHQVFAAPEHPYTISLLRSLEELRNPQGVPA